MEHSFPSKMKQNTLFFSLLLSLFSCTSIKINNAEIAEKVSGLPKSPRELELTFSTTLEKETAIDPILILEANPDVTFRVKTIYGKGNILFKPTQLLKPGEYQFVAKTDDKTFKASDNLVFLMTINKKQIRIKPVFKVKKGM
ncbi:MAG: hypothetical protein RLZZ292_1810 [Bacteroidota bacterium]|jgi:hypothetical protein